jgi:hypothetical protein
LHRALSPRILIAARPAFPSEREQVIVMVWSVFIGGGVGLLIGLAVLVGQVQAQENAWRAIARERREIGARRRELAAAAESGGCPNCGRRER